MAFWQRIRQISSMPKPPRVSSLAIAASLSSFACLAGCGNDEAAETIVFCPAGTTETPEGECVTDLVVSVNTVGYLPERVKRAVVPVEASAFEVRKVEDDSVVLTGDLTGPTHSDDTDQDVYVADFTELTEAGEYYLSTDAGLDSPPFIIGEGVYDSLLHVLMLGMYGQRCGTEVSLDWENTRYEHAACHTRPASLEKVGGSGTRDVSGGWHDAGDYGKYTVNASFSTGMMLLAWEHFPERLAGRPFAIPEADNDTPDYLDEIRVNIDWMFKMQNEDGSVIHKVTPHDFESFVMPNADNLTQYVSDWGTASTADFIAIMARAARVYADYDAEFASACLRAAERSYTFLPTQPAREADLSAFAQQQYNTSSPDDECWAHCEMWETTGDAAALAECETRVGSVSMNDNWDWSNLGNLCVITYATSQRADADQRDPTLVEALRAQITASADRLAAGAASNPWGLGYTGGRYWGINGVYARSVINLQTAYRIQPKPEYLDAATQQLDHLLGLNYYGRSQVTGIGHRPPMHPHHRPSEADGRSDPWPGLLVGGGNVGWDQRDDPNAPPGGTAWSDSIDSYQTNEVAINWSAAIIYAAAGFTH